MSEAQEITIDNAVAKSIILSGNERERVTIPWYLIRNAPRNQECKRLTEYQGKALNRT